MMSKAMKLLALIAVLAAVPIALTILPGADSVEAEQRQVQSCSAETPCGSCGILQCVGAEDTCQAGPDWVSCDGERRTCADGCDSAIPAQCQVTSRCADGTPLSCTGVDDCAGVTNCYVDCGGERTWCEDADRAACPAEPNLPPGRPVTPLFEGPTVTLEPDA